MKKYILIIAVLFCIQGKAQSIDTVRSSIQIMPYVVDAIKKDTAFQFTVSVFDLKINDTLPANSYIEFFDRRAQKIKADNVAIPYSVLLGLPNHAVIYNYIMQVTGLVKRN